MNVELQRRLFEAENHYATLKANQEKMLISCKRFFLVAVLILLLGSLSPFFLLRSNDQQINQLVGFATGILVLLTLLILVLTLLYWRRSSNKQLLLAETQLITAQKALIQKYMRNATQKNIIELGFPRSDRLRTSKKLGSTIGDDHDGATKLFELHYDPMNGYSVKVLDPEPHES